MGVANDEARHFAMLRERLQQFGHDYGDFDAHNGLWEMAEKTAHDGLARMALVPRVLEARGLDVTPGMIVEAALARAIDATADILDVILREEVGARRRRFALVPLALRACRASTRVAISASCSREVRAAACCTVRSTPRRGLRRASMPTSCSLQAEAADRRINAG